MTHHLNDLHLVHSKPKYWKENNFEARKPKGLMSAKVTYA